MNETVRLEGESEMLAFGASLAGRFGNTDLVFISGNLGAGKTTLVRGILKALGHAGAVPSPTYTLLEPYDLAKGQVMHMDLYRLKDRAELEMLGIRDFIGQCLTLIEWPEDFAEFLPPPEFKISISHLDGARCVEVEEFRT